MSTLTAQEMVISLYGDGLTDAQIADGAGTTQATITRIRNGVHAEPKHKTWKGINEFYLKRAADKVLATKVGGAVHGVAP